MSRRGYELAIAGVTLVFVALLVWPAPVLRVQAWLFGQYENFSPTSDSSEAAGEADVFDVRDINFAVSSEALTTPDLHTVSGSPQPDIRPGSSDNRLVVPSMGVDADVIISNSESALNQGLWHIPGSALPGGTGNTVIAAHRWLHRPPHPETFYRIDEVQIGDPVYYDYLGMRHTYLVTNIEIVDPEDVHILSQDENKLTLFTCHPLFSTKQRIVVSAELSAQEPI